MITQDPEAWDAGFKAGEERKADGAPLRCPYPQPSPEALAWYSGCIEGEAKRQGFSYSRGAKPKEPAPPA